MFISHQYCTLLALIVYSLACCCHLVWRVVPFTCCLLVFIYKDTLLRLSLSFQPNARPPGTLFLPPSSPKKAPSPLTTAYNPSYQVSSKEERHVCVPERGLAQRPCVSRKPQATRVRFFSILIPFLSLGLPLLCVYSNPWSEERLIRMSSRYFVNDQDEIRMISSPEERFLYRINANERYNELQREAMNSESLTSWPVSPHR